MHLLSDHILRYDQPPTEDITLEEFESCAIDRLYVLSEIESCYARNRPFEELKKITKSQCEKHVPLDHNSAITKARDDQRKKDITGHFVLRLAFCRSYVCQSWSQSAANDCSVREELRRRFVKAETTLFRIRYLDASEQERREFCKSRDFDWTQASTATYEMNLLHLTCVS